MQWQNELTRRLGITYPLIQAPMLGITTPAMVAAISNSGGLGSLPVGGLPPERVTALIREVKGLTQQPFAVNLFTYELPDFNNHKAFNDMQEFLQFLYGANRIAAAPVAFKEVTLISYRDQLNAVMAAGIKLVSFTFGMPDAAAIALLKEHHTVLIGTATSVAEAEAIQAAGVDMVVAQGIEAGGHRGAFLSGELPQVGTMALVPQMVDRVRIPVIAAGGIMDGRGIAAARMLGAAGAQTGSIYLRSHESAAMPSHKAALADITDTDTHLTRAFSGRWARGLHNILMDEVDASGLTISDYPYQAALTQPISKVAKELDNPAFTAMWAGQAAGMAKAWSAADIFAELIRETECLLP
ncbi:nitroalkane oxidase [Chitinophaga niastensis]|uniref:Nitronate monooxygenase n=1 Tax=Chitinophaga niastensis TaxID=536980 RepID=A0A2P8HAX3_CHINA|nr:nitronate monooxygenase [Chitinophaga niastensis]PSL43378.1 nitroalkane oxidase [Chitinophaga niastensis]